MQSVGDLHDLLMTRFDNSHGWQGLFDDFAVGVVPGGNRGGGGMSAGQAVDLSDVAIHLLDGAAVGVLGHAQPRGVAMRFFRQTADEDPLDPVFVIGGRGVIVVLPADDVGVHTGSADVLADLINDQQSDGPERQTRQPLPGQLEQFHFAFIKAFRRDSFNQSGFVLRVLDNADSAQHAALLQHGFAHRADDLKKAVVEDRSVIELRAFVLAESDQHHLVQPGLHRPDETRVRLDPAADDDVIALESMLVEVNRDALRSLIDNHRFHAGPDLRTAEFLGDAIAFDDAALAFRGASAVTAHGGNDDRHGPQTADMTADGFDDDGDVRDTAAAGGNGHRLARTDSGPQLQTGQLAFDLAGNVVQPGSIELLTDTQHAGKVHSGTPVGVVSHEGKLTDRKL